MYNVIKEPRMVVDIFMRLLYNYYNYMFCDKKKLMIERIVLTRYKYQFDFGEYGYD